MKQVNQKLVRLTRRELSNPASVLLLIRDGLNDWQSLCDHFGFHAKQIDTFSHILLKTVRDFADTGLIDTNVPPDDTWFWDREKLSGLTFKISGRWVKIQSALDISLKELAEFSFDSIHVRPLFGRPRDGEVLDVFVMMPFQPELQPVYEDHLSTVAKNLDLKIQRADDFLGAHEIMGDIWNAILRCRICIADCTGRNPNVFYEMGIAHTVGRPVVLIAQKAEDLPFDVRHIRHILYELTPRGMKTFEDTLRSTLVEELALEAEPQ